ncbi:glycosyltransferase [bacterium]|nr:glycosyltransferase [bacterium]
MSTRIVHIVFNQIRKLPPLMAELQALTSAFDTVVIAPSYDQEPAFLERVLPQVRIEYVHLVSRERSSAQTPLLKLWRFAEFTWRCMRELRTERPSIIVGHDMPGMLPLLPWLLRGRVPVLYNAHELWSEAAEDNAPLRGLWRRLERVVCKRAAHVIVPEPHRANIVLKEYGARHAPIVVRNIPPTPPPYQQSDLLRERFTLPRDAVIMLYQGLFAPTRCLLPLLESMTHLPPHFHLVLAGEGDAAYSAEIDARAAELSGRVHRLPWTPPDDLRAITASANLGILLYSREGRNNIYAAPNKLYEYLFAGLPIVSSAFPGLQAVIEGNEYGACAEPDDPEAIAGAIQSAVNIPSGKLLAARARAQFRWEDEVLQLRLLYQETVRKHHAR